MLSLLQGLRRLCAFHQGADLCSDVDSLRKESAKFAWLLSTLDAIRERQEKVILFIELREFQRLLKGVHGCLCLAATLQGQAQMPVKQRIFVYAA